MKATYCLPLLLPVVTACTQVLDPARERYEAMIGLPGENRRALLDELPASERVGVYLYGVENMRPSDYGLADDLGDGRDGVADELVSRLRSANSKEAVFGLVYALHGRAGHLKVPAGATSACDRFYPSPSPCHTIAIEVDSERGVVSDSARR